MNKNPASIAKITPPRLSGVVQRDRLFRQLDSGAEKSLLWVTAPAGSGKSTLVANWLGVNKFPGLWLRLDSADADPATFFYYLGLAAQKAAPRKKKRLSLLTPEYLRDIPTFSRRFFEEIGSRLTNSSSRSSGSNRSTGLNHSSRSSRSKRCILVFDNYQEIPADSVLHELLLQGLEALPEGAVAVVISRGDLSPQFMRLRANGRMAVIGWNELRFTLDEVKDAVKPWRRDHCLARDCPGPDVLFEKTDGWAAGLRLMIEAVEPQRRIVRHTPPGEAVCHCVESLAWKENVFSYFACEVMNRTDRSICDFLTATSFLPFTTPGIAEQLTGRGDAAALLRDLSRRNFFTEWHPGPVPVYQYHFLFREFLQEQARSRYDHEERKRIQLAGAELLEEAGFLKQAAELFCEAGAYGKAAPLISRAVWPFLAQGRSGAIEGLLAKLPQELFETDAGLLHVAGLDRMISNLGEARTLLEKAFQRYLEEKNSAAAMRVGGSFLEALIVEGDSYEPVDRWIDALDDLVRRHGPALEGAEEQISGIVLFSLAYRNPSHPSLPRWLERAEAAVLKFTDAAQVLKLCNYLMAYYLFSGDYGSIARLMKVLHPFKKDAEAVPALHLLCLVVEAYNTVYALGAVDEGIELARKGLALGKEKGVAIYGFWFSYLIVVSSVAAGNLPAAEECLASLAAGAQGGPPVRRGDLLVLSGAVAMGRQAWSEAAGYFQQAAGIAQKAGVTYNAVFSRMHLSRALFERGEEQKARLELAAAAGEQWARSNRIRCQGLLTQAYFDIRTGNQEKAQGALREGLGAAKKDSILTAPFWNPEHTALVCAEALAAGIEPAFVGELVRKHRLSPPPGAAADSWPWPVKIYTLGRFELLRDGTPLRFEGKVPKKPISLLKALIASGGRDVPEDRLMDALWPDAEGDAARVSLKIALHQLRQGLGDNKCILLKNGLLTISPDRCWVDAIAFLDAYARRADEPGRASSRAIGYYNGPFLPGDETQSWTTLMRERLKNAFIRFVTAAAEERMRSGLLQEAAEYYEKALDAEELNEDICRKLMICCSRMGRRDRVAQVYQRCAAACRSRLAAEPAEETRRLYERAVAGNI